MWLNDQKCHKFQTPAALPVGGGHWHKFGHFDAEKNIYGSIDLGLLLIPARLDIRVKGKSLQQVFKTGRFTERMNVLVFGKVGFVAGDLCELPPLLIECLNTGGYTFQLHFSAATTHTKVSNMMMTTWWPTFCENVHDTQIYTHSLTDFYNAYLPIGGSLSIFNHFEAWDFLSKEFHSDGHEQAAAISIAASDVYHQEYHKEDQHDDANHAAFGHALAVHFDGRERWKSQDDLAESGKHLYCVNQHIFVIWSFTPQYWGVINLRSIFFFLFVRL